MVVCILLQRGHIQPHGGALLPKAGIAAGRGRKVVLRGGTKGIPQQLSCPCRASRQISCDQRCGAAGGGKLHVAGQAAQSQRGGRGIHAQQDKFGFLFLHRQQQAAHIAGRRVYLHCRARRIGAAHALLHLALYGKILHQPNHGQQQQQGKRQRAEK